MTELVMVINAGSSSLKYSLVDPATGQEPGDGLVARIGEGDHGALTHRGPTGTHRLQRPVADHAAALTAALDAFEDYGPALDMVDLVAVGHRVVHGGSRFSAPMVVDDDLIAAVEDLVPLAPLHNPANLTGLEVARRLFPSLPHVAVFDTAFHQTLPEHAYTYAVPRSLRDEHGIRRYGFHGTSYAFVSRTAAAFLGRPVDEVNQIVLHLGSGASVAAIAGGHSVETSMGLTPLEGLMMGTRPGDVDPGLHAHLHRALGWSLQDIDLTLNKRSGLMGLIGDNDFRHLEERYAAGDPDAVLAFDIYCHRLRKYIGAYYAVLGRVDAVVFTGGVGEKAPHVRAACLAGLDRFGVEVDADRNNVRASEPVLVSTDSSEVAVLVVPTNEEWEIARDTITALASAGGSPAVTALAP